MAKFVELMNTKSDRERPILMILHDVLLNNSISIILKI